jgi:chitin synthase
MIVYILAIPLFAFYLPVYAFWHFDDFSWGNTRMVRGEKGKKKLVADEGHFDPSSIPKKKWSEYEQELWEVGTQGSQESAHSRMSDRSYRSKKAGSVTGSHAGSSYGDFHDEKRRGRSRSPAYPYDEGRRSYAPTDPRVSRAYSAAYSQHPTELMSTRGSQYLPVEYTAGPPGSRPISAVESYYASNVAFPTDDEILQEIRRILSNANLMSITKKQVRDELSEHFGIDMSSKKEYITNCIELILQGKL